MFDIVLTNKRKVFRFFNQSYESFLFGDDRPLVPVKSTSCGLNCFNIVRVFVSWSSMCFCWRIAFRGHKLVTKSGTKLDLLEYRVMCQYCFSDVFYWCFMCASVVLPVVRVFKLNIWKCLKVHPVTKPTCRFWRRTKHQVLKGSTSVWNIQTRITWT